MTRMTRLMGAMLSLICATAVIAGTPFSQMPDVGPIASWPHPTTVAFHNAVDHLINNRLNESELLRQYVVYIRQAYDGSPAGGGMNGQTPRTAWKCRNMADVRAVLLAHMMPNTTVRFRCGDTFYAAPDSNISQGIPAFGFGNYTLMSYVDPAAPSMSKPRLLGFVPINPFDLRYYAPYTYSLKPPCPVYWIRGRRVGTDFARGYRDTPYFQQSDVSQVAGADRTFGTDSQGNVRIRIGSAGDMDDAGTLEAQVTKEAGITVGPVDDVRIDGLIIEGWGMNRPSDGNGAIRSGAKGSNMLVVTNCEWGWTAYHGLLHSTNESGGLLLVKDCTFGFHVNRDSATGGGGDGLVSYAFGGNNELVVDGCRSFGGGLSRNGVAGAQGAALGMPVYQHAQAGLNIALHLRRNCTFVPTHPSRARYSDYAAAGDAICDLSGQATEIPADPMDPRYYRSFVIGETGEFEVAQFGGTWRTIDINCRFKCNVPSASSGNFFFWGGTRNAYAGLSINRDIEYALNPGFRGYYVLGETVINHNHVLLNNRIRVTGGSPVIPPEFFQCETHPERLSTCRIFNAIISNETSGMAMRWNYPNVSATTGPGGMSNCAFFHVPSDRYDRTSLPVSLVAAASFAIDDPEGVLYPLVGRGLNTLPGGRRLEYDALMRLRPASSTIGPLEGIPTPCRADVNGDGTIDFFDYLDFVDAWSRGEAIADFNQDQAIDLFDYLDFVSAMSTGC